MRLLVRGKLVTGRDSDGWRLTSLDRGAMLIAEERIEWIGEAAQAPQADQTVDLQNRIITPGLIDAHTHPVFGGNRVHEYEMRSRGATYQQIAADGGGIRSTMRATRAASEEELVETGKKHLNWMLSNGTTTLEAKSGYGLSLDDELKMLRSIRRLGQETRMDVIPTFLGAHAIPPEFDRDRSGYATLICNEILPQVAEQGLAEYADAFCEDGYFDCPTTDRILSKAKLLGLKLRMHADQLTRCGASQLAADIGAKTADHLEQTDIDGIRALKNAGVQPVLLPASVYALGLNHYPNARAMIDEGLSVVLATDFNPGSSPTSSLPFVMSLACTQMRMTPEEALIACTLHAATSLDRAEDRGSLEVGKRADFVVWDCRDYREIPYWIGAPLADKVFIKGREVFSRE